MRCDNSEAAVLREVLATFERAGWPAIRVNSGLIRLKGRVCRMAPAGTSDVLFLAPRGRFGACEVKRRDGKGVLSGPQSEFLQRVSDGGGVALVVADIRVLDRAIAALTRDPAAHIDPITGDAL